MNQVNKFKAAKVMASRYGDQTTGLRFFARKQGNVPEDSVLIEFDGMNVDQLIAELNRIRQPEIK